MQDRINKLGVSETDARKQGKDQIVIELPGVKNPAQAAKILDVEAEIMALAKQPGFRAADLRPLYE